MRLYRLSRTAYAHRFDGDYGIDFAGARMSGAGVTYCATGPALCVLEKLVHVGDTDLLPEATILIRYDVPDDLRGGRVTTRRPAPGLACRPAIYPIDRSS